MWPPLSETHGAAPFASAPRPCTPPSPPYPPPRLSCHCFPPHPPAGHPAPTQSLGLGLGTIPPPRPPPPHYGCKLAVTPPPLDRPIQLTHAQIGSCPRAALVRQPEVLTPRECPFVGLSHYGQTTFHRTPAPTPLTPPPHPTTTAPTRLTRARFPRAGPTSIEIKITSRSDLRRDRVEIASRSSRSEPAAEQEASPCRRVPHSSEPPHTPHTPHPSRATHATHSTPRWE